MHVSTFNNSSTHQYDILITNLIAERGQRDTEVINFRDISSAFSPPIAISNAIKACARDYYEVASDGDSILKKRISDFHNHHFNSHYTPDNIIIGPGISILNYALLTVFKEAKIVLPTPSNHTLVSQVESISSDHYILESSFDREWKLDPESFRQVAEECSPNTPLVLFFPSPGEFGVTYSKDELRLISEIASTHDVIIVSDETFAPIHHFGAHTSIAELYPDKTIILSSPSIWGSVPGWQLAGAAVPSSLTHINDSLRNTLSLLYSSTAAPIQKAARLIYMTSPKIDHYLKGQRETINGVGRYVHSQLEKHGIKVIIPEAGYSLLCDFSPLEDSLKKRGILSAEELCLQLLNDTGVLLQSGNQLGLSTSKWTLALSYSDFNGNDGLDAYTKHLGIDVFLMRKMAAPIIEGCSLLTNWVISLADN